MGFWDFLFGKPKTYEGQTQFGSSALPAVAQTRAVAQQPNVLNIRVGDVVMYDGLDFVVRNRQVYNSHGFKWFSYHLVDVISGRALWLDAEDDDHLEVAVCEPIDLPFDGDIPPSRLVYDGRSYREDEHGFANVVIESEASAPKHSSVEYWDFYDSSEAYFISVERWGGQTEASFGRYIEPFEVTILPGGGNA